MRNFLIRRIGLPASLAITLAVSTTCLAGSCDVLGGFAGKPHDGQLFYRIKGASSWTEMPYGGTSLGNTRSEFTYVIDESFEKERSGVVIVKTGRVRRAGEEAADPQTKSVRLVRHPQGINNSPCGEVTPFGSGSVSPKSYDDYHDIGRQTPDDATLDSFHFTYVARRNSCHKTNSSLGDSLSLYARSNRGQFSFDTDVVDRGTYFQLALFLHATTASASSEKLENQRVETRQYHVTSGTPECISFKYNVPGTAAFLRINDLEALSNDVPIRAPEHRWALSQP
jgi:hypothetical protein